MSPVRDDLPPVHPFGSDVGRKLPPPLPGRPSGMFWLLYLYFTPRKFFAHFVVESTPLLTAVCAWMYGMSSSIDRIEFRAMMGRPLSGLDTWSAYWALVAATGAFGAVLYYALGGWWYRVRLRWSGAVDPDPVLARRVYLFASLIMVLPTVLATVVESGRFSTPALAHQADAQWWHFALVLLPFWSVWNSYVGVRTAFEVRRGAAMWWFLGLPAAFYGVAILGVLAVGVVQLFSDADVAHPSQHQGERISFSYPGNWITNEGEEGYDPDRWVTVEPLLDAFVQIMVYESEAGTEAELQRTLEEWGASFTEVQDAGAFETWGPLQGLGRAWSAAMDSRRYELRVFVAEIAPGELLEVREYWSQSDAARVLPGFELIRKTFRLTPAGLRDDQNPVGE